MYLLVLLIVLYWCTFIKSIITCLFRVFFQSWSCLLVMGLLKEEWTGVYFYSIMHVNMNVYIHHCNLIKLGACFLTSLPSKYLYLHAYAYCHKCGDIGHLQLMRFVCFVVFRLASFFPLAVVWIVRPLPVLCTPCVCKSAELSKMAVSQKYTHITS